MMRHILILSIFSTIALNLLAQNPNKKKMDTSVFDTWKTINQTTISNNGEWVSYVVQPHKGDPSLVIFNTKTKSERFYERADEPHFSYDSQHLFFEIHPAFDTIQAQKRRKMEKDDLSNDTLAILNLRNNQFEKIPDLKNYKIPKKEDGFIAFQLEKPQNTNQDSAVVRIDTNTQAVTLEWDKKENDDNGSRLYILDLETLKEDTLFYVKDYLFAEENNRLLIHSTGNDSTLQTGIFWFDCNRHQLNPIIKRKGKYKNLTFDKKGQQAGFVVDMDTTDAQIRPWQFHYWEEGNRRSEIIMDQRHPQMPENHLISEHYEPHFSKDGSHIYFGINPTPIFQDTTLLEEEIVNVEVWSYQDKRLHTQQKVQLEKDKKKAFVCSYYPKFDRLQIISNEIQSEVTFPEKKDQQYVLLYNEKPYLETISWEGFPSYKDIYVYDQSTSIQKKVAKKVKANPDISPDGKYVYWYSNPDSVWVVASTKSPKPTVISNYIETLLADELNDRPMDAYPYGIAGWTEKDEAIWIYDRYDIWQVDPKNPQKTTKITNGRPSKTTYRYIELDQEVTHISANEPILLHTFNEITCAEGYAYYDPKTGEVTTAISSNHRYTSRPIKAQNSNEIIFKKENFQDFPNLWLTDTNFEQPFQFSNANPQQNDYSWGTIEHIEWTATDGQNIRGLLVKPENFDPNKKYPLIVNFYERSSNRLHRHRAPFAHRSTINYSFYINRGYVIFNPDVPYKIGYPGASAENAVLSGIENLVKKGFIDEDRIGVQGHSWGGYQVAHLVTKTNIFACAESGAPVVNMFSAYGGIRWRSGLSRMFQYEHTQSRIGATIWEKPQLYIENSPIFNMDQVETPLLILHNDKDGAVPWYQGIEFFVALRRLQKPAWLLNYNNEPHWPVKRQNRVDFQTRMSQFFDHYLMDAPQPNWMKRGIPAIEKGILQGLEVEEK